MARLESSKILENRLKKIECSNLLKKEIINFINKHKYTRKKKYRFSNYVYRNNLHYIENNILKEGLIEELRNFKYS